MNCELILAEVTRIHFHTAYVGESGKEELKAKSNTGLERVLNQTHCLIQSHEAQIIPSSAPFPA